MDKDTFKKIFIEKNVIGNKTLLVNRAINTGGSFYNAGYYVDNIENLETNECPECGNDYMFFFSYRKDEDGDIIVKCKSCGCEFYKPEFHHSVKDIYYWFEISEFFAKYLLEEYEPIMKTFDGYYWGVYERSVENNVALNIIVNKLYNED